MADTEGTAGAEGTGDGAIPAIDPELRRIVVCPDCHGELDLVDGELVCRECGLAYPIRDGIPVLLVDEARQTR